MTRLGYHLSSEEHPPSALVDNGRRAEELGFDFLTVSDHFHPWVDAQGQSPFVWSVLGGLAEVTERVQVGTAVTCPTIRTHPAIIAHAAATVAAMMPGRFFLGVGTGENLNEHVLGDRWPPISVRREMLTEAVEVMRLLWTGKLVSHHGRHYTVENARLYTIPEHPPPVVLSGLGPRAADLAAEIADGYMNTTPNAALSERFQERAGADKPRYGKLDVCFAEDEEDARRLAFETWPNSALPGHLPTELPLPSHFEEAATMVREEEVARAVICGPDPEPIAQAIGEYSAAGYDHVTIQQVGPDQDGFMRFYESELAPAIGAAART